MTTSTVADLDDVTPAELLELLGRPTTGADITPEEVSAFLEADVPPATRKRVLKWLSKVAKAAREKAGLGEPTAEVTVHRARAGRVVEWRLRCEACTKPGARSTAKTTRGAELLAIGHLREQHDNVGRIVATRPR